MQAVSPKMVAVESSRQKLIDRSARILKLRDFFFAVDHPGVRCSQCWVLIFSEAQGPSAGHPPGGIKATNRVRKYALLDGSS